MTTVAYRNGALAADTQMTDGTTKSAGRKIIYVREKRAWIGVAGAVCDCQKFIRFFSDEEDADEMDDDDDYTALVMHDDGRVECWTSDLKKDQLEPGAFYAIGSGGPVALGAMHMGADARRAVEVSMVVDLHTGGEVTVAKMGSKRLARFKPRPVGRKAAHKPG